MHGCSTIVNDDFNETRSHGPGSRWSCFTRCLGIGPSPMHDIRNACGAGIRTAHARRFVPVNE